MPTFSAQTCGSTIPSATPNVTRVTDWFKDANAGSSLAETNIRGQEFCMDEKVKCGHIIIVAHTHVYTK